MKEFEQVKNTVEKIKRNSQELNSLISSLKKEEEISTNFHILCLKKLSLQALDLFNAMEKQIKFYEYKKNSFIRMNKNEYKKNSFARIKKKKES